MINIIEEGKDYIIVTAPVFVPNTKDCEYESGEKPLTTEQISGFAHDFLAYQIIDEKHEFLYTWKRVGTLIESYITKEPTIVKFIDGTPREYPKGTWFVTIKITDSSVIQKIKDGTYTGVSATTVEREDAEKIKQLIEKVSLSTKSQIKRIKISEIKDPVVITISIVKSPCVPTAKFCSFKSKKSECVNMENIDEQIENETKGFISKIGEILRSEKSDNKEEEMEEEEDLDFVTAADFEDFKSEVIELITTMNDKVNEIASASAKDDKKEDDYEDDDEEPEGLTPEEEEELERLLAKKGASTKSEKEEDEEEDDEEEEEPGIKASSKSTPVHDNGEKKPQLSDSAIVYSIMGRDNTGSVKRE